MFRMRTEKLPLALGQESSALCLKWCFQVQFPESFPVWYLRQDVLLVRLAALIYTAGSVAKVPSSLMGSGRTLAVHMYVLSSEGLYMDQAYATAVILLIFVLVLNWVSGFCAKQLKQSCKWTVNIRDSMITYAVCQL